jgi:hypothetical protein
MKNISLHWLKACGLLSIKHNKPDDSYNMVWDGMGWLAFKKACIHCIHSAGATHSELSSPQCNVCFIHVK